MILYNRYGSSLQGKFKGHFTIDFFRGLIIILNDI